MTEGGFHPVITTRDVVNVGIYKIGESDPGTNNVLISILPLRDSDGGTLRYCWSRGDNNCFVCSQKTSCDSRAKDLA